MILINVNTDTSIRKKLVKNVKLISATLVIQQMTVLNVQMDGLYGLILQLLLKLENTTFV